MSPPCLCPVASKDAKRRFLSRKKKRNSPSHGGCECQRFMEVGYPSNPWLPITSSITPTLRWVNWDPPVPTRNRVWASLSHTGNTSPLPPTVHRSRITKNWDSLLWGL